MNGTAALAARYARDIHDVITNDAAAFDWGWHVSDMGDIDIVPITMNGISGALPRVGYHSFTVDLGNDIVVAFHVELSDPLRQDYSVVTVSMDPFVIVRCPDSRTCLSAALASREVTGSAFKDAIMGKVFPVLHDIEKLR